MVPDFRRDDVWTPAFAGVTLQETFYEIINFQRFMVLRKHTFTEQANCA
ncbi:MAG: hypothetical protein NTX30_07540 [Deltaproteobacteria bacterium]|jgi:hypothetical protein|nr:hypothetical protein [Deltaproteobacteria bacterium]